MENSQVRPDWLDARTYPFEDRWIAITGHLLHYVDEGPRDAPVLLFLPPAFGWSYTYRYHIRELRDEFRCVAIDLPGRGLSREAPGYDHSLLQQSRVIEAFVTTLDLHNVVVWANDGGWPGIALASHADRVRGFVVGGTFGWSLKDDPSVARMLRIFSGRMFRAINRWTNLLPRMMGGIALGTRRLSRTERRHYTRPFRDRRTRDGPLRLFRSFTDPATGAALDGSLPAFRDKAILIQFGSRDAMTRQGWPQRWAREIPNHQVHILPRVRHFTFEDAPEETLANFRDWWRDIGASSQAA